MESSGEWCLIESDPGVFTELVNGFGVKGVQFEEVIDLEYTDDVSDAMAFIFLFKWEGSDVAPISEEVYEGGSNVFFAAQVIQNACATQAIVNILCNLSSSSVDLGSSLQSFKEFCADFPPQSKGMALSNVDDIRNVHNSFATPNFYELDKSLKGKSEDNYHFVGYMPINGRLYELDGLQVKPIDHGEIPEGLNWIEPFKTVLKKRMEASPGLMFSLLALVPDRVAQYKEQLAQLESSVSSSDLAGVCERLSQEEAKRAQYARDQIYRRHNYIPFIIELMRLLAKNGQLTDRVKEAVEKAKQQASKVSTA
jgi:ubiquitin carboxyl-terminal hydrolase L5